MFADAERVLLQISTSKDLGDCLYVPPTTNEPKPGRPRKNGRRVIADASRVELKMFLETLKKEGFVYVGGQRTDRIGCKNPAWTIKFYRSEIVDFAPPAMPDRVRDLLEQGVFNQGQMYENPIDPEMGRGEVHVFICTEGERASAAALAKYPDRTPRSLAVDKYGEYCILDQAGRDCTGAGGTSITPAETRSAGLTVKLGELLAKNP